MARTPLIQRRRELAGEEARMLVGSLYSVLALHIDPRTLRKAADWRGVIENVTVSLMRYAESEAGRLIQRP